MLAVVPLVGTWIETEKTVPAQTKTFVVPLVGTWIETKPGSFRSVFLMSFPSWERGLKPRNSCGISSRFPVVPLVGTWIETVPPPR